MQVKEFYAPVHKDSIKVPFFAESVKAGFPSPASDFVEQTLDLNDLCIKHPAATYFVRASGDSMTGVGIYPEDVMVVDRSLESVHGSIVIAMLDGEFTVKKLELRPRVRLVPCNSGYDVIDFDQGSELEIFGVVSFVIHSLKT